MRLTRSFKIIFWAVFALELAAAQDPFEYEDLNGFEGVFKKLDALNEKVDIMKDELMFAKDKETQAKLEAMSQVISEIHQYQQKQGVNLEKQFAEINHKLEKSAANVDQTLAINQNDLNEKQSEEILNQNYAKPIVANTTKLDNELETITLVINPNQMVQGLPHNTSQLGSLENLIQNLISRVEYLESVVTKGFNLTKQDSQTELNKLNQTLESNVDNTIPSYPNCETALQHIKWRGVYSLRIPHTGLKIFKAYCLEDGDGGLGWTIIQRRQGGSVSFERNWHDYKHGFGDPSGEYWLGLEKIHAMTSTKPHELWIEFDDDEGKSHYAKYTAFEIGNEEEKYYLKTLGNYTGTDENDLNIAGTYKLKFTTLDNDNDILLVLNCAVVLKSAWWFDDCGVNNPNLIYHKNDTREGIHYYKRENGEMFSLIYTHMAIRPIQ